MESPPLTSMVTRRLTIILNSDQSKRITVQFDSSFDSNPKQSILRQSRITFKQDNISRVFLYGGLELEPDTTIPSSVKEVFVSMGEGYIPPPAETRIIRVRTTIRAQAIEQLKSVSELPGVRVVVGLPDLHPGARFPTGCAIAADDVYPALIGSDIGCGMSLYALIPPMRSRPQAAAISFQLADMLRGLDSPWDGDVDDWLESHGVHRRSPFDKNYLGTIGGGNHFAEICEAHEVVNGRKAGDLGIFKGGLYLLVHSGSRGLGAMIQAEQTADSNPCLPTHSPLLDSYLEEHDYAVRWAAANRDLISHRIMTCLFDNADDYMELKKILDVAHDTITRASLKLHSDEEPIDVWIHRKGAVPTDQGIVPCPGSRGDGTYILEPLGDGNHNIHSLAHGAGRLWPRQKFPQDGPPADYLDITAFGSAVVCGDLDALHDERAESYKPITPVVNDMRQMGICDYIAKLTPVVTYKSRGSERRT